MDHSGTLVMRVFTGRGQFPIEDAAISVVQRDTDGRQRLLAIRTTDRSGNAAPLTIEAPALQDSLAPDGPTPFSVCDIWVEHMSYQLLLIQNVQIFPGIESVQDLPLIPLMEPGPHRASRVDIPAQGL